MGQIERGQLGACQEEIKERMTALKLLAVCGSDNLFLIDK